MYEFSSSTVSTYYLNSQSRFKIMKARLASPTICLLSVVAWLALPILAVHFYVSPDGSDDNNGNSGAPFRTLNKSQLAVRDALASSEVSITVNVADGIYTLSEPLIFTAADSGEAGDAVIWKADGSNAIISGGLNIMNWSDTGINDIYSAQVPQGTKSRNLYVNGKAANYARKMISRPDFAFSNRSMAWDSPTYDWLMESEDVAGAEVRFINSFTDRYAPIESVGNRELVMVNHTWANQIIGYDTVDKPHEDFGVWVQNARSLLTEAGQFYLDTVAGIVYYKLLPGEDMVSTEAHLGILEDLIVVGGTYDKPAHDISFQDLNFVRLPAETITLT